MVAHSRGLGVCLVAAVLGTVLLAGGVVGSVALLQARVALRDDILSASQPAAVQTASYVADTRGNVLLADRLDVQTAMDRHDNDYLDDVLEQWSTRNPHNDSVFLFAEDGAWGGLLGAIALTPQPPLPRERGS